MFPRPSRHTSIRKISPTVRPKRRAASLVVRPADSDANSSRISKPLSRAGAAKRTVAGRKRLRGPARLGRRVNIGQGRAYIKLSLMKIRFHICNNAITGGRRRGICDSSYAGELMEITTIRSDNTKETRDLPLKGLLVLYFSQFLSGPLATLRLAEMGPRVFKIDRPGKGA